VTVAGGVPGPRGSLGTAATSFCSAGLSGGACLCVAFLWPAGSPALSGAIIVESSLSAEYFHAIRVAILHDKNILRASAAGGIAMHHTAVPHAARLCRWIAPVGGMIVETPHFVETKHAQRVFSFHRMKSFRFAPSFHVN
jgi:hypothetical protein